MNKLIKYFFIILILCGSVINAQSFINAEARGLFMSLSTGIRIPIADLSDKHIPGIGYDVTFSYTDNRVIPVFLYTRFSYLNFPGSQDFYKNSNYSNLSSSVYAIQPGIRFFYPPVIKNIVILMPVMELGATYAIFNNLHQFKIGSGLKNFEESNSKFGFHAGAGFSMFLIDVMAFYNYLPDNQYVSFDFRIRIPIYATM